MRRDVAVLMGGWSGEREVSLVSGRAVIEALEQVGFAVRAVDVRRDLNALLHDLTPPPDVVFNALHGRGGEDGVIQGVLEVLNVPYTHSGVTASAIAMDKALTRAVLMPQDIPFAPGRVITRAEVAAGDVPRTPFVLKPVHEGSSLGVRIVREGEERGLFDDPAWAFGDTALAEAYVPGRELTVAVMGAAGEAPRALSVTELTPHEGFYDYEHKYTAGRTQHVVPADIPDDIAQAAKRYASHAHAVLGCSGVTRSDFRWNDTLGLHGLVFLEINTQPGLTPLSLVPEQARHVGMSFVDLVKWMVEHARCPA